MRMERAAVWQVEVPGKSCHYGGRDQYYHPEKDADQDFPTN